MGVVVRRWYCTGNEMSSCVGGVVEWSCWSTVLTLRKLCTFWGIACRLPVDFWWPVNTSLRMGVLEAQDDLLGVWSDPSLPV